MPETKKNYDSQAELDSLHSAITNRQGFSYNAKDDPLYQSYSDRYVQNGRMAMKDSIGQSAALTGGYGSSYSQTAGQQQYNEYLRSLSEVLPELYSMAYQQYGDQGDALQQQYDNAFARNQDEYQRGRDASQDALDAEALQYSRVQNNYKTLTSLISGTGYQPTDEELALSGMSREQAEALRNEYLRANGLLPQSGGGGGGGGGSSSSSSKKTINTSSPEARINASVSQLYNSVADLSKTRKSKK